MIKWLSPVGNGTRTALTEIYGLHKRNPLQGKRLYETRLVSNGDRSLPRFQALPENAKLEALPPLAVGGRASRTTFLASS
ncbi:hypothetical protein H6G00_19780 [Leptolyngbya sp. FACHB-541]|uniref:hypothetical protein n=1 Tax=Leptolyngbya sp. FACHB-541 TaxID=2692810 RepID=UPI001683B9C6|nr:hypothetical protein [Leptolyngbya sp. FACHB-541]MBD1998833.1 hypothetical protein [Leptolyngbya sp. FACHB-541]